MKKEKLIEELQKLPDGIEVCIFDWRKELHNDPGDGEGCSAGIYPTFDVEIAGEDFKAENSPDFAVLSFSNDDYDNDGRILIEPDEEQPSISPEGVKVTDEIGYCNCISAKDITGFEPGEHGRLRCSICGGYIQ